MTTTALPEVSLTLPARPESVTVVRQAIAGLADAFGWDEGLLADIKLAVTEACTNVVVHAYDEDLPGPMRLSVWIGGGSLRTRIEDEGRGITPVIGGSGLGIGFPIMVAVCESVTVSSRPGERTRIDLTFALPETDATPAAGGAGAATPDRGRPTLYHRWKCPWCVAARQAIQNVGLDVALVEVPHSRDERRDVIAVSGQPLVPVLVDGDDIVVDSRRIARHVYDRYGGDAFRRSVDELTRDIAMRGFDDVGGDSS